VVATTINTVVAKQNRPGIASGAVSV